MALPQSRGDREYKKFVEDADGNVAVRAHMDSDIQIGSVELKDESTDNRANINDANTVRTNETHVLAVQDIDASGKVSPAGDTVDNAPFVKLTDGVDTADVITQDAAFGAASKGLPLFGKYEATPTTYTDGDAAPILLDANGRLSLSSDIQIGAVELKDGTTDNRADINSAGTGRTIETNVVAVQNIDGTGKVLNQGTAGMDASIPVTIAVNDTMFTALDGAVDSIDGKMDDLTDGTQKSQIVDGSGNVIGSTGNALDVNIASGATLEVNLDLADDEVLIGGTSDDGTTRHLIKTDANGELQIDVLSSALPTGAATEATLATIDADTSSLAGCVVGSELQSDIVTEPATAADAALGLPAVCKVVAGYDGANVQAIKTDANGELQVDILSSVLAPDAATETTLAAAEAHLGNIDTDTTTIAGDTTSIDDKIPAKGTAAMLGSSPVTIATDDTMFTALDAAVDSIDGKITACDTGNVTATVSATDLDIRALVNTDVVTAELSATDNAVLDAIEADTTSIDSKITACNTGAVVISSGAVTVSGTDIDIRDLSSASDGVEIYGSDDGGTTQRVIKTDAAGDVQVDVLSMPSTTVTATDLDIRALSGATDEVDLSDDANRLVGKVDCNGSSVAATCTNAGTFAVQAAPNRTVEVTNASGSAAINTTTSISAKFRLSSVTVHLSAAPTTSENLTISVDANDGDAYDTVLYTVDPSASSATDIVLIPDNDLLFESGDEIKVAYTNTDARLYGLRIVTEVI